MCKFELDASVDLMAISDLSKGACGAELTSLTDKAAIKRGNEKMSQSDLENAHARRRQDRRDRHACLSIARRAQLSQA